MTVHIVASPHHRITPSPRHLVTYHGPMSDPDFPDLLRSFIQETIPTIDSAELLIAIARERDTPFHVASLIEAMRPTAVTEPAARRYLIHFQSRGLVEQKSDMSYQYKPASGELDAAVDALTRVYNARPVTLVRMIYAPKDEKIRSFADAFRLKK